MKRWLISLLFIPLCCGTAAAQSLKEKQRIAADIRAVMDKQVDAWNAGDLEGFMAGYWRSPDLTFISGDKLTRGWQTTLDNYKKGYDSRARMGVLTFSDIEVNVLSRDAAVVIGTWALQRQSDRPHGKFTLTFRKLSEGWRIVLDHTS
jgi:uncharacterized protein (TIGR02246 family)